MPEKIANAGRNPEDQGASFLAMFWEGLKPFPGRGRITLRLAVACTLIVLVSYTFRMPFQDLMPFFLLFITKEEKVTTAVTAILVLFAVTIAIAAALLIYKFTGDRPEIRVPIIALEIFVGMYLFRVFAIGPVGWIIGFVCAAAQSVVYLFPSPEEAVHQFLWLWVAIAFSVALAWLANLLFFPISPAQIFQRDFAAGWQTVCAATERLAENQTDAGLRLLRPFVKSGPIRLLKLLKLSSMESADQRTAQGKLKLLILNLDKISRLLLAYAKLRLNSPGQLTVSTAETAVLAEIRGRAETIKNEFAVERASLARPTSTPPAQTEIPTPLREAEKTLDDLAVERAESEHSAPPHKPVAPKRSGGGPSLFVPDAFTNPRHAQFAIKVTLAGMIGYLFYTASDYYGIHTVFYTPLIIALSSAGATIHKGFLRIVGCCIGGGLGLICTIWLLPRFESLGVFLFIVFCLHGLAAWIAVGSEKISYIGLQIALAFDLGFLQGYGPPEKIDPLRDRFIGIVLGIGIVTVVFSLIWPESAELSAREQLAVCLRGIARLLRSVGASSQSSGNVPGAASSRDAEKSQPLPAEREQLELEIASHLSQAYSYEEQVVFEALLYGESAPVHLEEVSGRVEEIYVATLPCLRETGAAIQDFDAGIQYSAATIEACADRLQPAEPDSRSPGVLAAPEHVTSETLSQLVRVTRNFQNHLNDTAPQVPTMEPERI